MDLSPVKISSIRIEDPLPFSLLGPSGTLLLKKGSRVKSRADLETMAQGNDSLFIDRQDAQALKRHQEGQMLTMLARDSKLANITQAGDQVAMAKRSPARLPEVDKEADWPYLQEQAHASLRNGREAAFLEQVDRHRHQVAPRLHVLQQAPLSGPGDDDRAQYRVLLQRTGDFTPQRALIAGVIKAHIDAWRARNAMARHVEVVECANDCFFDAVHIFFDVVARTLEVNQRIGHHLARAMKRDLATTIGGYNGNIARGQ
jgi:hypothetical protein